MQERRLTRSTSDRQIAGVCGGLAEYFSFDPVLVRIAFVVAVLLGLGSGILVYVVLWIAVPEGCADRWRATESWFHPGHRHR